MAVSVKIGDLVRDVNSLRGIPRPNRQVLGEDLAEMRRFHRTDPESPVAPLRGKYRHRVQFSLEMNPFDGDYRRFDSPAFRIFRPPLPRNFKLGKDGIRRGDLLSHRKRDRSIRLWQRRGFHIAQILCYLQRCRYSYQHRRDAYHFSPVTQKNTWQIIRSKKICSDRRGSISYRWGFPRCQAS